jgi:uncharacterized heparinase superfamily protein
MKLIVSQCIKYWNTIRYLRYVQISGRLKRYFKRTQINEGLVGNTNLFSGVWAMPARRSKSLLSKNLFHFLNETHTISSNEDWNNKNYSKLWLYNLHYFNDLSAINAVQRTELHRTYISQWTKQNPIGFGNGWEPYPLSLRIVNWIKWSLAGNLLEESWLHSLGLQARYLSKNLETHLMGNHIFSNAKALVFAGLFFEGDEAKKWLETGSRIIDQELEEQILKDGGNFELSTMYHMLFLEDLLDLINIHLAFKKQIHKRFIEKIEIMFNWLLLMCHPDGEISFFNDATFGVAPSVLELNDYRNRIFNKQNNSLNGLDIVKKSFTELSDSGYTCVQMPNMLAIIDRAEIGPDYLPGHAHADTLSFELSLFGQRVVVNSGIHTYDNSAARHEDRSTSSHSTIVIDGQNSSEVWSAFRVARRARIFKNISKNNNGVITLSACHDGYKRLPGKKIHCREWTFEEGMITITDLITGKGECIVDSILPIHPNVHVELYKDNSTKLEFKGNNVLVKVEGNGKLNHNKSRYHRGFGESIENIKLIYSTNEVLPIKVITRILW